MMFAKFSRFASLCALLATFALAAPRVVAQTAAGDESSGGSGRLSGSAGGIDEAADTAVAEKRLESGESSGPRPVFEPEHGTWFNILARNIFATPEERAHMEEEEDIHAALLERQAARPLTEKEQRKLDEGVHYVAKYDFLLYTPLLWGLLAIALVSAAKKAKIRPEGKPASNANLVEAAVDAFQDYLGGVMGNPLARKYTPLIASFFFTILVSNWLGLIPGMLAASAQPAIPIAMAIVAFFSVHIIAIKEAGFKSWFTHFLGEPLWLAPLNFPLHLVGELIKPLSLSLRLLCNVFGEEAVVATLAGLAITMLPAWLPIPFQLPMLFLGTFFGFLQALVFSTLLAIYISILATHHDDHDAHNGHGHVDHEEHNGHKQIMAHPSEMSVG